MNIVRKSVITSSRVLARLVLATAILLLVPLAIQLTIGTGVDGKGFNWRPSDLAVMDALIFITGSVFVLTARKLARKYWLALGIVVALAFLYVWAKFAAGLFFNFGS